LNEAIVECGLPYAQPKRGISEEGGIVFTRHILKAQPSVSRAIQPMKEEKRRVKKIFLRGPYATAQMCD
jgi:hypothetical protein